MAVKERSVKFRGLTQQESDDLLPEGLILLAYRGSIAHGMYIPRENPDSIDDKDVMGVFVAPYTHYIGLAKEDHKSATLNEWDVVCYEVRKMISLLLRGNPNVLSLLWVHDRHVIFKDSFSQFKRMSHFNYEGRMGAKRKRLADKFGYDTKNASHLIRLLRMGIEFLTEGRLYVERADAEQLLAIKKGEWSLDRVKQKAERLFLLTEEAYLRSSLPAEPDRDVPCARTMIQRFRHHPLVLTTCHEVSTGR